MKNCKHIYDETNSCFECDEPMTPSQRCKALGFNLKKVSELSGVSPQTLSNWHKDKPELFKVVLAGVEWLALKWD